MINRQREAGGATAADIMLTAAPRRLRFTRPGWSRLLQLIAAATGADCAAAAGLAGAARDRRRRGGAGLGAAAAHARHSGQQRRADGDGGGRRAGDRPALRLADGALRVAAAALLVDRRPADDGGALLAGRGDAAGGAGPARHVVRCTVGLPGAGASAGHPRLVRRLAVHHPHHLALHRAAGARRAAGQRPLAGGSRARPGTGTPPGLPPRYPAAAAAGPSPAAACWSRSTR